MIGRAIVALLLGVTAPASGQVVGVDYNPNAVVDVQASSGFATVIELGKGETIDTVVVGDSANWQVSSPQSDQLVIKPAVGATQTNMIVSTDRRRYVFTLTPNAGGMPIYVVQFNVADSPPKAGKSASPAKPTGAFRFTGARSLYPIDMRVSGNSTTIRWPTRVDIPAVFAVRDDGSEVLTNGRMVGDAYVIDGTSQKFAFKLGRAEATATRRTVKP